MDVNKIYNEDCLETLSRIPDNSIDLMLTDPPYNTTACEWDCKIDLKTLWKEWLRIGKDNCAFVFTSSQPFTTDLINSNRKMFKYELIWEKDRGTNFLQAKYQPLKLHENILVFYKNVSTYNPQKEIPKSPNSLSRANRVINNIKRLEGGQYEIIGKQRENHDKFKTPESIIYFQREIGNNQFIKNKVYHPTQKPVDLFRYLIKTYSNEGDTVFDGYMGSGTTAIACIIEKRNFIGSELDKTYFDKANKRIEQEQAQLKLF